MISDKHFRFCAISLDFQGKCERVMKQMPAYIHVMSNQVTTPAHSVALYIYSIFSDFTKVYVIPLLLKLPSPISCVSEFNRISLASVLFSGCIHIKDLSPVFTQLQQ